MLRERFLLMFLAPVATAVLKAVQQIAVLLT